jgi:hypothetical protein
LKKVHRRGGAEGEARGEAKAKAESVVKVLELRQVPLTDANRQIILSYRDIEQMDRWFERALVAEIVEELLEN